MSYHKLIPGLIISAMAPSVASSQNTEVKNIPNETEILAYTKKLLSKELGVPLSAVKNDAHLQNDLGMDSLDAVILIMEIEKHFQIPIPDELLEDAVTVEKTVEMAIKAIAINKLKEASPYKITGYQKIPPIAAIEKSTGKHGYLNTEEKVLIDFKFDKAGEFTSSDFFGRNHRFTWVFQDGKYNVINTSGEQLNTISLDSLDSQNYFSLTREHVIGYVNGKVGVLNSLGEIVVPFNYDEISMKGHESRDFIFLAQQNNKTTLLNRFGKIIPIKDTFDDCYYAYDRGKIITFLEKNDGTIIEGAYDYDGTTIFEPGKYTFEVNIFTLEDTDGIKLLWDAYATYFYDEEGDDVIGYNKYHTTLYATVKKNGKIGVVDTENNIMVPFQSKYRLGKYVHEIDRVLAYDPALKKFGFLNRKGEIVIPFKFDVTSNLGSVSGKFYCAATMVNGRKCYFNEHGDWIDGNGQPRDSPE